MLLTCMGMLHSLVLYVDNNYKLTPMVDASYYDELTYC
jgi:hypothetical protein